MASRRRKRRRSCTGKKRHRSYQDALRAVRGTRAFNLQTQTFNVPSQDAALGAYKCSHCGFWHVGHKPGQTSFIVRRRRDMKFNAIR